MQRTNYKPKIVEHQNTFYSIRVLCFHTNLAESFSFSPKAQFLLLLVCESVPSAIGVP